MSNMGLRLKVVDEAEQRRFLMPVPRSLVLVADLAKHVHRRSESERLVSKQCFELSGGQFFFQDSRTIPNPYLNLVESMD